jgi:hypothetical protein
MLVPNLGNSRYPSRKTAENMAIPHHAVDEIDVFGSDDSSDKKNFVRDGKHVPQSKSPTTPGVQMALHA